MAEPSEIVQIYPEQRSDRTTPGRFPRVAGRLTRGRARGLAVALGALLVLLLGQGTAAEGQPPPTAGTYRKGFGFMTGDGRFSIRLSTAVQARYSYVRYDDAIEGNDTHYSNFFLRRARLWWQGHAYDPRFTYYFHLQLEPTAAVNLHDVWLEYRFHDLARLGLGRMKIGYGLEFLESGFGLNFVERSVMCGETDINSHLGLASYPGRGTGSFGLVAQNPFTGFPTGGMTLYRSQGVQMRGRKQLGGKGFTFEYQAGLWQGRATLGRSNRDDHHLLAGRVGLCPFGWIDWTAQGDMANTRRFKLGLLASTYTSTTPHSRNATGNDVPRYQGRDRGVNLALEARYRGFSGNLEWSRERYEVDDSGLVGEDIFERQGWRLALGYFVKPKTLEAVGRYAEIRRLRDPSVTAARNSGLGLARVRSPAGGFQDALERNIRELTLGLNLYLSGDHQHKLFIDFSRLTREFVGFVRDGRLAEAPEDQKDSRIRAMLQFKL